MGYHRNNFSLKKNLLISIFSAATKILGTVVLVALLARVFSLSDFGDFTYSLTLGTLVSLLVDFGYNLKVIKDVSVGESDVAQVASVALFSKLFLFSLAFGLLFLLQVWLNNGIQLNITSTFLFVSLSLYSLSNTFLSVFKGLKKYALEYKIVAFDNLFTFVSVSLAALLTKDIVSTSIAFSLAKLCTFLFSFREYLRLFKFIRPTWDAIKDDLHSTLPYAVHYWVGNAYLNVDTIIMESYVDSEKIGIYQSGIRIVLGMGIMLTAINAVYLPLFNQAKTRGVQYLITIAKAVNGKIFSFAIIVSLMMLIFGKWIILVLFGKKFLDLESFFWVFVLIVFLRIIGAFYGILLTISNKQGLRAVIGLISVVLLAIADIYLIPIYGYKVAALVLLAAHLFINLFYSITVYLEYKTLFLPNFKQLFSYKPLR